MNFELKDITLSCLTFKLITLLALAAVQRAETLHLIDIRNTVYNKNSIIVNIPIHTKKL